MERHATDPADLGGRPARRRRPDRRTPAGRLRLGWESYGEGADTLWYDDVAAGNTRNGC